MHVYICMTYIISIDIKQNIRDIGAEGIFRAWARRFAAVSQVASLGKMRALASGGPQRDFNNDNIDRHPARPHMPKETG